MMWYLYLFLPYKDDGHIVKRIAQEECSQSPIYILF